VIRQFLVLFLATFPFGILQKATWLPPLITASIAFPMLALDEIGAELQNPFSKENVHQLLLDLFCQNLEGCLRDFLEPKSSAIPRSLNDFLVKNRVSMDSPRIFRADVLQKTVSSLVFIRIRRCRCYRLIIVVLFT
jgi:putative membrane protein